MSSDKDNSDLFAEFLDDYFAESEEHLTIVRRNLLLLEPFVQEASIEQSDSASLPPTLLEELFRSFHTIKGLSGMVGVREAEQVAHEMESYLRSLRQQQVLLTAEGLDALISGTKMLELLIDRYRTHNPPPDIAPVITQLTALFADDSSSTKDEEAGKEQAAEQGEQTQPIASTAGEQDVETEPIASTAEEQGEQTQPIASTAGEQDEQTATVASGAGEQAESLCSTPAPLMPSDLPPLALKPEESERLAAAVQSDAQAWRFLFIPEPELSQRGINVNVIRERLKTIGEIVHASPQVTGNGGIAFNFLVASPADVATFTPWCEDGLTYIPYLEEELTSQEPQVPTPQPQVPTLQPQIPTPQPQVPTLQPQAETPQPQVPTPQPQVPTLQPQAETPQPPVPTSQLQVPTPQPQVPTLQPQVPTPQPQVPTPQLQVPTPQLQVKSQESPPLPLSPSPPASAPAPSTFVRVDLARLDELMRMVGALVITRARLGDNLKSLKGSVSEPELRTLRETNLALERQLRDLREGVMRVRLVPIGEIFARMQFVIRDIARESKKQIALELSGQNTEIDKFVVERMMDPLLHLVRNAVSHGLESEAERLAQGKSPEGKIALRAATAGEMVVIEIEDDGRGVDVEKVTNRAREQGLIAAEATPDTATMLDILCSSGFSTRDKADLTSGRGVGMAVVKNTVQELGGFINLDTRVGSGTKFTIQLPLTLAIADALTVSLGGQTFAVPQSSVREVLEIRPTAITVLENNEIFSHRGNVLPLIRLAHFFGLTPTSTEIQNGRGLHVVVLGSGLNAVGILVDRILGQREIVVRPLTDPLVQVMGIAGATELGDGRVVLILDTAALLQVGRLASWKVTHLSSKRALK